MTGVLVVAVLLVLLVLGLILQNMQARGKSELLQQQVSDLRQNLQTMAAAQAQSSGQISAIAQGVTQRLDNVSKALQDGVSQSAQLVAQSQSAAAGQMQSVQALISNVQKQLGEFQESGRGLSQATQALQNVLGGAKTRGILGEITLERLLEDSLPASQYKIQYRFSTGEVADAVVLLRDGKLMAIDSKFPLEAFRRIQGGGEESRRAFVTAVKGHADAIAKKYIAPSEGTLDVALMFVPSESVYYEFLMSEDGKGNPADSYCREKKVIAVSPNTLYAHLCVIAMGLRGMQIEENAKRLAAGLDGVRKQMEVFEETFEKLGTHLRNAQQSHADAGKRFAKAQNTLGSLVESTEEAAGPHDAPGLPFNESQ
jgi:DNA recombination protein RmuC